MRSQANRLLGLSGGGHGTRGGGRREELVAAHGYDTKYAMHCSRLGFQCLELLDTGKLNLPIHGAPNEWLRSARRGEVSFDEWWHRTLDLDAQLEALETKESLPPAADRTRIEAWSIKAHREVWDLTANGLAEQSMVAKAG